MRYQVPQFIEVEDKIIGPFTIKQFVYLVGGAGMCFVAFNYLYIYIAIPVIAAIAGLSLALAFYKVNGKSFIFMLEAAFLYYTKDKIYIWKKEPKKIVAREEENSSNKQVFVPRLSESKLKELSWSLDINENLNPLTGEDGQKTK